MSMSRVYTLHDLPAKERPRERLQELGAENLSTQELLALIIEKGREGQNVLQIAQNLLSRFGNLQNIKKASLKELQKVNGIGFATACKIKAALRLGERSTNYSRNIGKKIENPRDIFNALKTKIGDKKKEHFTLVCLNARNYILSIETISIGTLDSSLAHPREIFLPAIKNSAASVIIAHNHPSGDPTPSKNDKDLTQRLCKAGKILGIKIADHVIVTQEDFLSFVEEGFL
ncbi:MAG: DNA repair protein RadC [Patescibacteria group bacterium]|nr:DNA repair protein RadC [Patescibacteria group bacterium]